MTEPGTSEPRVSFEALISDISAAFVNLPPGQLDEAITDALRRIVDALDLDRAAVFLRDGDDLFAAHRWARPGTPLPTERLSARGVAPWFWARVMDGEVVS